MQATHASLDSNEVAAKSFRLSIRLTEGEFDAINAAALMQKQLMTPWMESVLMQAANATLKARTGPCPP